MRDNKSYDYNSINKNNKIYYNFTIKLLLYVTEKNSQNRRDKNMSVPYLVSINVI